MRAFGFVLLILGLIALVHGTFFVTREEKKAELGPIKVTVEERERFHVPAWAGVLTVLVGGGLIAAGGRPWRTA
jgi:hypothetical protein